MKWTKEPNGKEYTAEGITAVNPEYAKYGEAEKRLLNAVLANKAAAAELVAAEKALFEARKAIVMSGFAPRFSYKTQKQKGLWRGAEDNICVYLINEKESFHFVSAQDLIDVMYQEGLIKYFDGLIPDPVCGVVKNRMVPVIEFWETELTEAQRVAILSKIWAYQGWGSNEAEHELEMAKYTLNKHLPI